MLVREQIQGNLPAQAGGFCGAKRVESERNVYSVAGGCFGSDIPKLVIGL